MVQHCRLLQVDWVVVLLHMLHYSRLLHNPLLVGISVFFQSHLQSLVGLSNVNPVAAAGDAIYHIALLTKR